MKTSAFYRNGNPVIKLEDGRPTNAAAVADAIYSMVYTGDNKHFQREKISEITDWLEDGSLEGGETAEYLAAEWREYDDQADDLEDEDDLEDMEDEEE